MIAVWSFWSKPFLASRKHMWVSEKYHLLSWILSLQTARKHFQKTVLFTDDQGAQMLIEGLGLEFDTVSTELNTLAGHDPRWWALGKIFTYSLQREPFVIGASCYRPEQFESAVKSQTNGWLPEEWLWYRKHTTGQRAESCGIFGGCQTDFINHYATLGIHLIEHPANRNSWNMLSSQVERNILVEQYFLSACIEFHKNSPDSPYFAIDIHYLFATLDEAFDPKRAADAGYTHLIADTKKNKNIAFKLENRVRKDYPMAYERCLKYVRNLNTG